MIKDQIIQNVSSNPSLQFSYKTVRELKLKILYPVNSFIIAPFKKSPQHFKEVNEEQLQNYKLLFVTRAVTIVSVTPPIE